MKYILLVSISIFCSFSLSAQPWLQGIDMSKPQKLEDIVERYRSMDRPGYGFQDDDFDKLFDKIKVVKEGENYQFERWLWHAKQHTDDNGYLVSPLKTYQEWTAYLSKLKKERSLYKTTGNGVNESNWVFQGPTSSPGGYAGVGRTQIIAFHPTDTNTYWIGSGGGGAWKTTNDGSTWTNMTNSLPVLGVSDIDINPVNPSSIYLCTGDRDASDTYSIGVLKSTDGGITWDQTGLQWTVTQNRLANSLAMNAQDTNSLILASSAGIYKSQNGGTNWNLIQAGNFKQILYSATDTNVILAAGSGPSGGVQIWRSVNGGYNWSMVTSIGNSNRICMAVTAANPRVVKAVVSKSDNGLEGIYSSSDTGHTFKKIMSDSSCKRNLLSGSLTLSNTSCGGQGWYDLTIAISPLDSNKVYVGGINTYYSANGGKNWQMITQWYGGIPGIKTVHADKHYHAFNPLRPGTLYECNDGGIYRSSNPASTAWTDLTNGLGITQFYRNAVSNVTTFALGGSQDNGTKKINNGVYTELTGGDGMNCEMHPTDPAKFYTATQYGNITKTVNGGTNFVNISNNIPGQPDGAWITPYTLHPAAPSIIMAGYKRLYFSQDEGASWYDSSIQFTSSNITRITLSPAHDDYIYLLISNTLRYTTNFNTSWASLAVPYAGTISDILADPKDATHLWVTFSGYGANKVAEYWPSNGGWKLRNDSLPNIPVNCITIDSNNGTKYIGTDVAVFYQDTSMTAWRLYNTNMPSIEVTDLGINYTTNEIWCSTYGRGMWKSGKHFTDIPVINGVPGIGADQNLISVSPNPNNGRFAITTKNAGLASQNVVLKLISEEGRIAWSERTRFNSGRIEVNATSIAKGYYILELAVQNGAVSKFKLLVN